MSGGRDTIVKKKKKQFVFSSAVQNLFFFFKDLSKLSINIHIRSKHLINNHSLSTTNLLSNTLILSKPQSHSAFDRTDSVLVVITRVRSRLSEITEMHKIRLKGFHPETCLNVAFCKRKKHRTSPSNSICTS